MKDTYVFSSFECKSKHFNILIYNVLFSGDLCLYGLSNFFFKIMGENSNENRRYDYRNLKLQKSSKIMYHKTYINREWYIV